MEHVIGVDGGATKSSVLVADTNGKLVCKKAGRGLNYHATGREQARENLKDLLLPIFKKYKKVKMVVIGSAGLDNPKDFSIYNKIAKDTLPKGVKFTIFNDAEIAIAAMGQKEPKILIISGTGASVFGKFKNRRAKAVGWDFLLADEGSAYWLGLKALKAAVRSWDGREEKSILEKLILEKSGTKRMEDFLPKLYKTWHQKPQDYKKYIASFAPVVDRAYLSRDLLAKKIIEDASKELALGVSAVTKRLQVGSEELTVGFVGSNFKNEKLVELLISRIKKMHPNTRFVHKVNSVEGALNLAIKLS